jgi:hypothetical protein
MNLLDLLKDMYSLVAHCISLLSPRNRANLAPKLKYSHRLGVVLVFHFGKEILVAASENYKRSLRAYKGGEYDV